MTEADTIARCQRGDGAALLELFTGHREGAYRYCVGMLGDRQDALEIVQEAFLAAMRGIKRLDPERGFAGWFYGIVRHLCLATLRQRRPRTSPDLLINIAAPDDSPEARASHSERRRALARCLDELTANQREVIVLRELEGHSYREIAERLEIPEGTVMSRLYDARRALARAMRRHPVLGLGTEDER